MKIKDVKILWGRSGNRCAFPGCKIELTTDGAESTLGEMAHIVAASNNGPRGESNLTSEARDEYPNLILLCPTHHSEIDSNPEKWTIEKLKRIKAEHEQWVSNQLEQGGIFINKIDYSVFLESREKEWINFAGNYVWIIVCLTPLNISDDSIDPLTSHFLESINNLRLPSCYDDLFPPGVSSFINTRNTRPHEYGVVNEDFRYITEGFGHKIQIFRNGHCEFLVCLEGIVRKDTQYGREQNLLPSSSIRVFRYTDISMSINTQIQGLINIWQQQLKFNDILLTAMITSTVNATLFSGRYTSRGYEFGYPVTSPSLKYSKVINKNENSSTIVAEFIKRFVNCFGLYIDNVFDDNGNINYPRK